MKPYTVENIHAALILRPSLQRGTKEMADCQMYLVDSIPWMVGQLEAYQQIWAKLQLKPILDDEAGEV